MELQPSFPDPKNLFLKLNCSQNRQVSLRFVLQQDP